MSANYKETHIDEPQSSFEAERLLGANGAQVAHQSHGYQLLHLRILYSIIAALLVVIVTLSGFAVRARSNNPQLALWSPVNDIVGYQTVTFDAFFLGHESPWTRGPKEDKDVLWDETYQFGISWLTKKEASHLLNKTLPAPHDSDKYMIQLEVFHNLHCLNMLRKSLYPDQYPEMWEYHENGTVNHNTLQSLHMDHCIDALRQSTMCEADVTPIPFVRNYFGRGVFPNIVATHTCRDFDAIVQWAKEREVQEYEAHR